MFNLCLGKY